MEITNEEKAKEIHSKLGIYADAYYGAMAMAQWKDEQHKQNKQQWIENACKWWEREFLYPTMAQAEIDFYQTKIAEFKKAMED